MSNEYESRGYGHNEHGEVVEVYRVHSSDPSNRSGGPAPFGPNDTGEAMLKPIENRIETIRGLLAQANGFDPSTGAPRYDYAEGSTARKNLQRELALLEGHTLPLTRKMAAEADAYHASQPTQAEKIQAQKARQDAITARALELADEAEAKQKAERILRGRGLTMG